MKRFLLVLALLVLAVVALPSGAAADTSPPLVIAALDAAPAELGRELVASIDFEASNDVATSETCRLEVDQSPASTARHVEYSAAAKGYVLTHFAGDPRRGPPTRAVRV